MVASSEYSALAIAELTIAPYSVRGVQETIELDFEPDIARDWNGNAHDLTPPQYQKFKLSYQCRDIDQPTLDGVWTGMQVTVDTVQEVCLQTATAGGARTAVSGSERSDDENGLTFYRMQITGLVETYSLDHDEAENLIGWTLVVREA